MTLNEFPQDCSITRFEWIRNRVYIPDIKKSELDFFILEPIFEEGWLPLTQVPRDIQIKLLTELGFVEYSTIWKNYNTGIELDKFIRGQHLVPIINGNQELKKKYSPTTIKKELDLMHELEIFTRLYGRLTYNFNEIQDSSSVLLESKIQPELITKLQALKNDLGKYTF